MTLAQDWRIHASMHLGRLLTRKEVRKTDVMRRAGHKLAEIIETLQKDAAILTDDTRNATQHGRRRKTTQVRKVKSGWVCLESGGVAGREVLYKRETLVRHGFSYNDDPNGIIDDYGTIPELWLRENVEPDRVLKVGHTIQ